MLAYVFNNQSDAQAVSKSVDAALGYPMPGTPEGGGMHAPPSQGVTSTYFVPIANAMTGQWAYIADANSEAVLNGYPNLPTPVDLDGIWGQ